MLLASIRGVSAAVRLKSAADRKKEQEQQQRDNAANKEAPGVAVLDPRSALMFAIANFGKREDKKLNEVPRRGSKGRRGSKDGSKAKSHPHNGAADMKAAIDKFLSSRRNAIEHDSSGMTHVSIFFVRVFFFLFCFLLLLMLLNRSGAFLQSVTPNDMMVTGTEEDDDDW
jgi:hypothetical protein